MRTDERLPRSTGTNHTPLDGGHSGAEHIIGKVTPVDGGNHERASVVRATLIHGRTDPVVEGPTVDGDAPRKVVADVPRSGKASTKPGIRVLWDQMLKLEAILVETAVALDAIRTYLVAHEDGDD